MLVDDHPLLRKGLKQLLAFEDDLDVIAEASNGADALLIAEEQDPDLIILDLHMQGMDGLETLTKLRDAGVTSRIVMLTVSDSDEDVLAAISQGADGYLLKDTDPDQLLEQIKLALTDLCTFFPARRAVVPKFRSEYGASAVAIQPPGIRGNRYSSRTGKVFYADRPLSTALYLFAFVTHRTLQFPLQLLSARW